MAARKPDEPPRVGCPSRQHDTLHAYRMYRCRCPAAVKANADKANRGRVHRRAPLVPRRKGRAPRGTRVDKGQVAAAVAGRLVDLNQLELAAAIAQLARRRVAPDGSRRRWSAMEIARQVGCSYRTVQRHRAALRATQGVVACRT